MDRFFVPNELTHMITEDKSVVHPGMGSAGFGKKKKETLRELDPKLFESSQ
jgi:hypothetical protein